MKTFKQSVTESAEGDSLYEIKLNLAEWWKTHSKLPQFKKNKPKLEKLFNGAFKNIDEAIDMVYDTE
jgi:hypothetical protein